MCRVIKQYLSNEDGATAIEYGLIVALIGLFVSAVVLSIGVDISANFTFISSYL